MGKKRFRPRSHGGRGTGTGYGGGGGTAVVAVAATTRGRTTDKAKRPHAASPALSRSPGSSAALWWRGGSRSSLAPPPLGRRRPAAAAEGAYPLAPQATEIPLEPGYGLLEMHPNGYGFLRSPDNTYTRERSDPFVPGTMIEKYGLRQGVMIKGTVQPARRQQGPRLREITDVDGMPPEEYLNVKNFRRQDADQPGQVVQAGNRPAAADHARAGPAHAAWPRAAGADRRPAAQRQDDLPAAHQPRHDGQLPRRQAVHPADRRAAGRSDRHAAERQGRGLRQQPRRGHRKPRPPLAARHRALQAAGRDGAGRVRAARFDHPPGPRLQQVRRQQGRGRFRPAASASGRWTSPRSSSPRPAPSKKAAR